jgi:hypothetical protein
MTATEGVAKFDIGAYGRENEPSGDGEPHKTAVFSDGHIEVARFTGTEAIEGGAELLQQVISQNRD